VDNRLAFIDQASFLGLRALEQGTLDQCTWIYHRAIDIEGLRRFHANLGHGLMGRRIERSPLTFGRDRWVTCHQNSDIDFAGQSRPRTELSDWTDQRAQLPIDPEFGPAWHLGVLPLQDGATAVTLVVSHCVVDGLGFCLAIADAANGVRRDLGYPLPRSRTRRRAALEDARLAVRGAPGVARALVAAAKLARHNSPESRAPRRRSTARTYRRDVVVVPAATAYIDLADWDIAAKAIGGTSNSLVAGFAAKLAEGVGRLGRSAGSVTLSMPVSQRVDDDSRANALTSITISVDPSRVTTDLREVRAKTKHALAGTRDAPNEMLALLPLTPFVPKSAVRRLADVAFGYADLPVGCSNMGDIDPAVSCADGTESDYLSIRLVEQRVTKQRLERTRGQLFVASGRVGTYVFITVVAYHLDRHNSKPQLCDLISRTLADFGLTGRLD
jgi:hypothetical protein